MKMGAPLFAFFAKGGHDAAHSADFDFAGAPSFAQFAKGGNHERLHNGFVGRTRVVSAASLPALAKSARACPEQSRRDGTPTVLVMPARSKAWATRRAHAC
jgi:hypothetical protein